MSRAFLIEILSCRSQDNGKIFFTNACPKVSHGIQQDIHGKRYISDLASSLKSGYIFPSVTKGVLYSIQVNDRGSGSILVSDLQYISAEELLFLELSIIFQR